MGMKKQMEAVPVTGPLLCAKAPDLSKTFNGEMKFLASEGWKWRLCQRHGIHQLSVQGEGRNFLVTKKVLIYL